MKGPGLFAAQSLSLAGLLSTHSHFIMAPVWHGLCHCLCYGPCVWEEAANVQPLGKSVWSGQVPVPFGMTLKQVEKIGHRAFWELRSLVARSLSSLKKKKNPSHYLPLSQIPSLSVIFFQYLLFFYFMLLKFHSFGVKKSQQTSARTSWKVGRTRSCFRSHLNL